MSSLTTNALQTCPLSDVEANVQHVAVLNLVGLSFEALEAGPGGLRVRTGSDEVVPADHLGADESARDVRVDRRRCLERVLPATQRPGARLLVAGREETDQPELLAEAAHDLL